MRDIHQLIGPKRKVGYADEGLGLVRMLYPSATQQASNGSRSFWVGETLVAEMWMAREGWWIRIKE